jgi:aldehyde dehydrogenase (NAD+)
LRACRWSHDEGSLRNDFYPSRAYESANGVLGVNRIISYIESGKNEGASLACGGERVGNRGYFIQPTVFADVRDDMKIAQEESLGPVMSVIPFRDMEEVIQRANRTSYGLAADVWTRDIKKAHAVANGVRAGTVWINCYHVLDTGRRSAASSSLEWDVN